MQKKIKPKLEDVINTTLSGEKKKQALEFVDYVKIL